MIITLFFLDWSETRRHQTKIDLAGTGHGPKHYFEPACFIVECLGGEDMEDRVRMFQG